MAGNDGLTSGLIRKNHEVQIRILANSAAAKAWDVALGRSASHDEGDEEQDYEYNHENLRNPRGVACDAAETQYAGDDRDDQKDDGIA